MLVTIWKCWKQSKQTYKNIVSYESELNYLEKVLTFANLINPTQTNLDELISDLVGDDEYSDSLLVTDEIIVLAQSIFNT